MKIRGVFVKLKGKERNEWSGMYGDDEQSNSFSSIKFLRTELPLRGEGIVDVGSFECPFSFQLPLYIPDSFEGPYGGIRYTVDAKVDIPFAPDYTDKKEIIVFNPVDLNSVVYQEYWGSATYSKTKTPFSWCCNGGGITMDVYLAKRAFVSGEKVQVKVHVYNQSNAAVNMVIARISRVKAHFVCRSDMEINTVIMLGHIPVGNPHHQNETRFLPP
ncbi:hypothetical protein NQ315_007388 [Exocentrus adspersus]|uniref:Arrestin-like N-terminal domain-containing protein n=1 Tax=Exocentrus adspersus TaxID=1586481 RepID=A0AAV8VID9_9CUCU|nr:hypothetical protein NQ315_007388 [Exocentrus adspersus]